MDHPTKYLPVSYLVYNAGRFPDKPALYDAGRTISFRALEERVKAIAAVLRAEGLQGGEVVAVHLPNVWEYVALELAIPYLEAVIMPLPLSLGEHELEEALRKSGAAMLVTGPDGRDRVLPVAERMDTVRAIFDAAELCARLAADLPPVPSPAPDPDRIVEIALTSGTTGLPKLAALSASLKQATAEAYTSRLEITPDDRVLIMSPLTQGIGGMCLFCLRLGAALVMLHEPRFTAEHTLEVAQETGATMLVGVPTNVSRLLASDALGSADLSSVRATAVAGAPMPPEVAQEWEERTGSRLVIFYGSMDAGQLSVGRPSDIADKRWNTVGKPHDVAEILICDGEGRPVAPGEIGEICMRGPTVQERYWGEDRGPHSADGWAHMGDLGFLDEDGYLHVVGRMKDIIIRGGSNINPYEVERILRSHPKIEDACVVGRPDNDLGERAAAFLVPCNGAAVTLDDLRAFLEEQGVAKYKWPEFVDLVEEIPLSGPGKINRRVLRERARSLG